MCTTNLMNVGGKRACRDKLVACRRQADRGTQQSELPTRTVAYQQEQKQEGQLRHDLSSKQQLEQRSVNIAESTTKPTPASNKNKQNGSLSAEEAKAKRKRSLHSQECSLLS